MVNPSFTADTVSPIRVSPKAKRAYDFTATMCGSSSRGGYPNRRSEVLFTVKVGGAIGGGWNVFVTTQPDVLAGAAGTLSGIGDSMVARNAAAAGPTTGLSPAASDLVSAMTAAQFGQQGTAYQQIAAQAAEVHEQLVAALRSGAGAYALTEANNAATAG
ncbi:MAG: hypothetical protein QOI79_1628 [Mycobacterium sp.]|nr:hypothetical protein [Mycobacterium sp.]